MTYRLDESKSSSSFPSKCADTAWTVNDDETCGRKVIDQIGVTRRRSDELLLHRTRLWFGTAHESRSNDASDENWYEHSEV